MIWFYSDFLLYDMGFGLVDGWLDFEVSGNEWCILFLWGIGLIKVVNGNVNLLYDGRVCLVEEVIFWYGGEVGFV